MLEGEENDYNDPVFASLDKHSTEINDDLEFQLLTSKRDFHHEELSGWCVSPCDLHRFKLNIQRKVLKTPNKEQRTNLNRRTISRQNNYKQDIEYDFKHYRNVKNYIEQYRNDKITRQDGGLSQLLSNTIHESRKLDLCGQCNGQGNQSCETTETNRPLTRSQNISTTITAGVSQGQKTTTKPLFRGGLYGVKDPKWKENMDNATTPTIYSRAFGKRNSIGLHSKDESWTVVGVEKRPVPPQRKRCDLSSTLPSYLNPKLRQKQNIAINQCETWVRNREEDLVGSYTTKTAPRSNSAPNIGTKASRQHLWRQSQIDSKKLEAKEQNHLQTKGIASNVDYSCYTEMFKNVLEYYGTKKLKPKSKLSPSTENVRLLSIKS